MGRKAKNSIPQSGIGGLVWRTRGNVGSWVCVYNLNKEEQERLVTGKGTRRKRIERSTRTASLALAKRRYPEVMSALKAEVSQRALLSTELPVDRVKREIANAYIEHVSDEYLQETDRIKNTLKENIECDGATWYQRWLKNIDADDEDRDLSKMIASERLKMGMERKLYVKHIEPRFTEDDLSFTSDLLDDRYFKRLECSIRQSKLLSGLEKEISLRSIDEVRREALITIESKKSHFAQPSALDGKIRDAARQPLMITFDDILKIKKSEVASRTYGNTVGTVRLWINIIGSNQITSIGTSSLNKFARTLKRKKEEGGRGYTTHAANNAANRIRSFLKTYNVNVQADGYRLTIPEWEPIKLTVEEKKLNKITNNAISEQDARKLLQHAANTDKEIWVAILILCNTTFRINELMDLRWGCIKELDGVMYFDLTESKTVTGIRRHPLNTRLIKYLLPIRQDDPVHIVPLHRWSRPSVELQRWLKGVKQTLGIQGKTNAHSFRHAAGGQLGYHCSEHIKKKLMGHSGGITDHYTREDMNTLKQAVEYIGFDLEE